MIKFFRKIRQRLLTENKFSKYLIYAIGEIVLVVFGILIALQINNWNEHQKEIKAEKVILNNLTQEFQSNIRELQRQKTIVLKAFESNRLLMSYFGKEKRHLQGMNMDSLIFSSVEFDQYNPSENAIQDLLQSGRFDLISNDRLKNLLFDWTREYKITQERYDDCDEKLREEMTPYLTKNYLFKDIDQYGNLQWKTKSTFEIDKYQLFKDYIYENLTDDFMYRLDRYLNSLDNLEDIIDEILQCTLEKRNTTNQ